MSKKDGRKTMEDVLRAEIASCGLSFREISRRSCCSLQVVTRFSHGYGTLRLDHADKLAAAFGLELVKRREENAHG